MIPSPLLETFASFAEDASLSRAARRLHLSQPAVHAQLRRLSELLGVALYARAGRGLVLTPAGLEVAAFAREAREREGELVGRMRGEHVERRVVLAAGAGALLYVVGEGLRSFARAYEGRLDIVTADAPATIEAVTRGAAHVGVIAGPVPVGELERHRIVEVGQVLVAPKDHPLAKRRTVRLVDLAGERLVLPPEGRPQRAALDAALAAHGVRVKVGAIATGWDLVMHLVGLGVGLAVVNGSVRLPRGLVPRPLRELPRVAYAAITRRKAQGDPLLLVKHLSSSRAPM
ncbi:MAG: LysR family transcriptional regulator [Deltaproteobacteria bacterium]|nr:LysR family transcriptional regulator [Deltaproteobacteria bacterium]